MSTLQVVCVLPAPDVPAWMDGAVSEIEKLGSASVFYVPLPGNLGKHPPKSLRQKLEEKWFAFAPDPLAPIKPSDIAQGETALKEKLAQEGCDILLDFAGWWHPKYEIGPNTAVWTLHFYKSDGNALTHLVETTVDGQPVVLAEARTAISTTAGVQNRAQLYWKSSWLPVRCLERRANTKALSKTESAHLTTYPALRAKDLDVHKTLFALLRYRLFEYRGRQDFWSLRLYRGKEPLRNLRQADYLPVLPPEGIFWADPFLFEHHGETWLFFEQCAIQNGKGTLAACQIQANGQPGPVIPVLQEDWHLSYPFVFTFEEKVYMIPESSVTGRIDLYECLEFPHRWVRRDSLAEGMHYADTTIVEKDGLWWMFTCATPNRNVLNRDELYLYYSDTPIAKHWTPHPQNPVVNNTRTARPAGRIFCEDGVLYRPSQDNGKWYGHGVVLNRITTLTTQSYAEERVEDLYYDEAETKIVGTHTYNQSAQWTVNDVLYWRKNE